MKKNLLSLAIIAIVAIVLNSCGRIIGFTFANLGNNGENSIPRDYIGKWDITNNQESNLQQTIEIKEGNTFVETWTLYDDDGEQIGELNIQGKCELLSIQSKRLTVEKAFCRIYDLESLSDPDDILKENDMEDYFKEENEKYDKAQKKGQVYGLPGIHKNGTTLHYEGGQWEEILWEDE